MCAQVTYLLGAGASMAAVPLAAGLTSTMAQWAQGPARDMPPQVRNVPYFEQLVNNIGLVCRAAEPAGGIDTYAKVLYLANTSDSAAKLYLLKATLAAWLMARQRGGKIDLRYVHFLGGLADLDANGQFAFNPKACILTWNYDLQIELTLALRMNVAPDKVVQLLNAPPADRGQQLQIDEHGFFLARINGVAGAHRLGDSHDASGKYSRMLSLVLGTDTYGKMAEIAQLYGRYLSGNDLIPAIDFAWEDGSMWRRFLQRDVLSAIANTRHLVVIGYSFPSFNADIDRTILQAMSPVSLTVQDPNASDVRQKLRELAPDWDWDSIRAREVTTCAQLETVPVPQGSGKRAT